MASPCHVCCDLFIPVQVLCKLPLAVPLCLAWLLGQYTLSMPLACLLLPWGYGVTPQLQFQSQAALGTSQPLWGVPPFSGEGRLFSWQLLQPSTLIRKTPLFSREVQPLVQSRVFLLLAIWPDPSVTATSQGIEMTSINWKWQIVRSFPSASRRSQSYRH